MAGVHSVFRVCIVCTLCIVFTGRKIAVEIGRKSNDSHKFKPSSRTIAALAAAVFSF